jgi:cell division protein FtsB
MIFLDTHSLKIHNELDREVEKLEIQKNELDKLIKEDNKNIKYLENNDSLERFARENYGHKKENETIFYIEYKDLIKK